MRLLHRAPRLLLGVLALVAFGVVGCGWLPVPKPADPFGAAYPTVRDEATGITAILGTPDLGVGTFRVAIALSDRTGLIRFPGVPFESQIGRAHV